MLGKYKYRDWEIEVVDTRGRYVIVVPVSEEAHRDFGSIFTLPYHVLKLFEHETRETGRISV